MPLARHFIVVGVGLLGLLLLVSSQWAKAPLRVTGKNASPTISLRSDQKLPDRVVYDADIATPAPPQLTKREPTDFPSTPPKIVAIKEASGAMAQLRSPDELQVRPSVSKTPTKHRRV